jgi:outer membrane protein assembly factor BamD (BamD/ComL family)
MAQNLRARRNQAEAELRARLMAQAQECVNKRDWAAAVQHAHSLIQRFPRTPEAQALRMQLPTLRENAEIKERQQMEAEIRELVHQQRFDNAVRAARQLVEQYPHSPQAEVLRQQLPKLEEKAAAARA